MSPAASARSSPVKWLAVSVFCISSTLNYLDRLLLASVAPLIIKEFHLTTQAYGWLLSGLALAYALASPLAGAMLDWLGLNRGAALAVGAWSLCCAATSLVRGFGSLAVARLGLGVAESAGIPSVAKMAASYLKPGELAVGSAISQLGLSLGGMMAPALVYVMLPAYGWRGPFVVAGALGLLWIPIWLLTAHYIPPTTVAIPVGHKRGGASWTDRRTLLLGLVNILGMSTYVLWSNFTTVFLTHTFHETAQSAAAYAWFPPLAASLGGFAGGWLSMRMIRAGMQPVAARTRVVLFSAIGCLITVGIPFAPSTLVATLLVGASYFATLAGTVNVYSIPVDLFGAAGAATSVSVLVAAYGLLQVFLSPLIGGLADHYGYGPICVLVVFPPFLGYWLLKRGIVSR
jgi:ACS family hexuronate transporter-like MFS transporter